MNLLCTWRGETREDAFPVALACWSTADEEDASYGPASPWPYNPESRILRLPRHWQWIG